MPLGLMAGWRWRMSKASAQRLSRRFTVDGFEHPVTRDYLWWLSFIQNRGTIAGWSENISMGSCFSLRHFAKLLLIGLTIAALGTAAAVAVYLGTDEAASLQPYQAQIVWIMLAMLALSCAVAGACLYHLWLRWSARRPAQRTSNGQTGSVFFALFGALAMVGVLGASMNVIMRGPVTTMQAVTKRTIAENNMIASAKLSVMAATNQPGGGDCDADGMVEPVAWSTSGTGSAPPGGGFLPPTLGASLLDPWANSYGYCVWDHGTAIQTTCPTPTLRLKGTAAADGPAIVILSSGPDRVFQTTCADEPDYFVKPNGSDDLVMGQTYFEANAASGGLWNIKSGNPAIAEIDKDIEVKNSGGNVVFGVDSITDASKPSIKVDYIRALNNAKIEAVTTFLGSAGIEATRTTNSGRAIVATASSTGTGANYGVLATAAGETGRAVYGEASFYGAFKGPSFGVYGTSAGYYGRGVAGFSTAALGAGVGGYFSATSPSAYGVYGYGTSFTGPNYGLFGRTNSDAGYALYAEAAAATGTNYGVYGTTASAAGYGGYFENTADGWGVFSADDVGIAEDKYLNWGTTRGSAGYGIRDNNGVIQVKNDGGFWVTPGGGGGLPNCDDGDILISDGGNWICSGTQQPDPFSFTDVPAAALNTLISSNIIQITGLAPGVGAVIAITGDGSPQYRICLNATCTTVIQAFGSAPSTIQNNQYVQLTLTSANAGSTTRTATLTIAGSTDAWDVATPDCPNIGNTCADGTKYAGTYAPLSRKLYVTPADAPGTYAWNNGNLTGYTVTWHVSGSTDGKINTTGVIALDSDSGVGGTQPHQAAQYCADLVAHGHSDWYLPSSQELTTVCNNRVAIGGFTTNTYYGSNSYNDGGANSGVFAVSFSACTTGGWAKQQTMPVRCVRAP